jgi:ABC-type lipoprotein export system ATPase subunit
MTTKKYERGAEWRQWDLHIHTPASFHWLGQRFDSENPNSKANADLVDEMIKALNDAEPTVFALMDYWTFDGWFALKKRLAQEGAPKLHKRVFPGIELRLVAPMAGRLNAHVLFSDAVEDQILRDFKSALQVELINRPLSDDALIALARMVGDDKLIHHGINKLDVDTDLSQALRAGSTIAEINCDSYKKAITSVPNGQAVGFMPFNTSDGLAEVKWQEHYAYCLGLFKSSPIFETRDTDTWGAFVGERTPGNTKWIDSFQKALGGISRLAVSGSDAHCFVGKPGDNDKRGYGDFPSGKKTWIKSDPTFLGLLQAIKEPAKRSYIGERPDKLREIEENRTYFINRISVAKNIGAALSDKDNKWLDGVNVLLNPDLVAIIGNKGNGKSALADVIALLGNSHQKEHFSFLVKNRFRGKSGEPAKHFIGEIEWFSGNKASRNLNEDPPDSSAQLIRHIPQGRFESLCNDHVSGKSNAFQKELQAVIFDHASESIRLGALDFDQLVDKQESRFRDQLIEYRKELTRLNGDIEVLETQSQPHVKNSLLELLDLKKAQIAEHNANKPDDKDKPSEQLSPEQQEATKELETIAQNLKEIEGQQQTSKNKRLSIAEKRNAVHSIRDRIGILERQYAQFQTETVADFQQLELAQTDLVFLNVNVSALKTIEENCVTQEQELEASETKSSSDKELFLQQQANLHTKLNEPQLRYQQYLKVIEQWTTKLQELTGTEDAPETLRGLETRISQLDDIPQQLAAKQTLRQEIAGEIFDTLNAQRKSREELFKPVQDLIQSNKLIRDDYRLQFQATLGGSSDVLTSELFSLIKQKGEFRGEDESYATVKLLAEQFELSKKADALKFVKELDAKIHNAASNNNTDAVGIASILRKDRTASVVYDLLYGLSYLEPRYSLLFQEAPIEQLSPGQRGALLLIFYLLVDNGRTPIILDQPEENLDNETVVSLLVPVLTEAKKKRQIIMVTHNPNLAVVCDAEQVIYSTFDRKNGFKISYVSGAIENPVINGHVVNVLEGTKPAFNNRRIKYH